VFSRLLEPDYVTQDLSNILEVLYNIHLAAESFRMRDSVIRGIHNTEVIVPMDGRSPDLRIRVKNGKNYYLALSLSKAVQ